MQIVIVALYDLIWIINTLIFIRAIFSWFPGGYESRVGSILVMLTEPVLAPVRRLLMKFEFARSMPFDFSPMVAFLILLLLQNILRLL